MGKRMGKQTVALSDPPVLRGWAAVAGKKEGEGPLRDGFDQIAEDPYFGELSWEKAESRMLRICFSLACDKAGLPPSKLDYSIASRRKEVFARQVAWAATRSLPYSTMTGCLPARTRS